jgi:hypothetical protein
MQMAETTPVVRRICQSSGYSFIRLSFAKGMSGRTTRITEPAPVTSDVETRRNRGVRCSRFVGRADHLSF